VESRVIREGDGFGILFESRMIVLLDEIVNGFADDAETFRRLREFSVDNDEGKLVVMRLGFRFFTAGRENDEECEYKKFHGPIP